MRVMQIKIDAISSTDVGLKIMLELKCIH